MIEVGLAICVSVAAGVWAARRFGEAARAASGRLLNVMLWGVLPPCAFVNIAHFDFSTRDVIGLLEGYLTLTAVGAVAWWFARRRFELARGTAGALICCAMVGNTGYFGIPVTLALLGRSHLSAATAWDAMISGPGAFIGAFLIGSVFGLRGAEPGSGGRVRAFLLRNPVLWAIVAGLLMPRGLIPHTVAEVAQLTMAALLPVGFGVLGIQLYGDGGEVWRMPGPPMLAAIGLRMGLAPGVFAAMALLTHGVPSAFYLQAAAPAGLNALITSHVFGLDSRFTASVVMWSTAVGLVVVLALALAGVA